MKIENNNVKPQEHPIVYTPFLIMWENGKEKKTTIKVGDRMIYDILNQTVAFTRGINVIYHKSIPNYDEKWYLPVLDPFTFTRIITGVLGMASKLVVNNDGKKLIFEFLESPKEQ